MKKNINYDRKKSPSFFYREVPVHFLAVDVLIETVPGTMYLMREVHASWSEWAADGNFVYMIPRIEVVNAINDCLKQNVAFPLDHIVTPGVVEQNTNRINPVKRAIKLNDPFIFRQSIHLRLSWERFYQSPVNIRLMILGYQIEE